MVFYLFHFFQLNSWSLPFYFFGGFTLVLWLPAWALLVLVQGVFSHWYPPKKFKVQKVIKSGLGQVYLGRSTSMQIHLTQVFHTLTFQGGTSEKTPCMQQRSEVQRHLQSLPSRQSTLCVILLYSVIYCYILLYIDIQCYILLYIVIYCYILLYSVILCYKCLQRCDEKIVTSFIDLGSQKMADVLQMFSKLS